MYTTSKDKQYIIGKFPLNEYILNRFLFYSDILNLKIQMVSNNIIMNGCGSTGQRNAYRFELPEFNIDCCGQ